MANHELMSIDDQALANIMNKRHRSKCNFKNPPQPKFCIKVQTLDGKDVFINVLSYARIASQQSELDPIPLYFGMQIRSFSSIQKNTAYMQLSPSPLIFAVMASPEVLKNFGRGRSCTDSAEQMNLVELMCEFVEAMNEGIVLSKKPEILKDRDLTGELKDIWSAVQSFRDKEKAGVSDIVVYTEFGPESALDSNGVRNELSKNPSQNEVCIADENAQYSDMQNETEKENEKGDENAEHSSYLERGFDESDSNDIEIDQLSLLDKKLETKHEQDNEKIVKIQNQKNKDSQHTFFPKFLSSSKEREPKDKDKEKEKQQDELEPKGKNKKSLSFFRRIKSSSSPTHTNNSKNNQKSDSNADH